MKLRCMAGLHNYPAQPAGFIYIPSVLIGAPGFHGIQPLEVDRLEYFICKGCGKHSREYKKGTREDTNRYLASLGMHSTINSNQQNWSGPHGIN